MSGAPAVDPAELDRAVEALRALAYQHRLHILVVLRAGESTPAALGEVISAHPTVISHHLRNLADAGLIRRDRRGRHVYYSLRGESTGKLIDDVMTFAGS